LYDTIGLGTTIWSPLASGVLTGKYNDGIPDDSRMNLPGYDWLRNALLSDQGQKQLAAVRELTTIAQDLGTTMARMAIAWCLKNPRVSTVITGASCPEQVVENMQAEAVVPLLTADVIARIDDVIKHAGAAIH
jgi:aryl-alcohol dehydrogenase-like predicted oxidoreductase